MYTRYTLKWHEKDSKENIHECFEFDKDPVALMNWFEHEYKKAGRGLWGIIIDIPELTKKEIDDGN